MTGIPTIYTFDERGPGRAYFLLRIALARLLGLRSSEQKHSRPFHSLINDREFLLALRQNIGLASCTYGVVNEFRNNAIQYVDALDPDAITLPPMIPERSGASEVKLIPLERRTRIAKRIEAVQKQTESHLTTPIRVNQALSQERHYPLTVWERGNGVFLAEEGEIMALHLERRLRLEIEQSSSTQLREFVDSDDYQEFIDKTILKSHRNSDLKEIRRWGASKVSLWLQKANRGAEFVEWRPEMGYWFTSNILAHRFGTQSWKELGHLFCDALMAESETGSRPSLLSLNEWLRTRRIHLDLAESTNTFCILAFTFGPLMDEDENLPGKARSARLGGLFVGSFCSSGVVRDNIHDIKTLFSLLGQHNLVNQMTDIALNSEQQRYLGATTAVLAHKFKEPISLASAYTSRIRKLADGTSKKLKSLQRPEEFNAAILADCSLLEENLQSLALFVEKFLRFARAGLRESKLLDLNEVISAVLKETQTISETWSVSLSQQFDSEMHCIGDRVGLAEVFINLIENAIQAMQDRRGRHIELRGTRGERFNVIQIKDSGPGISPQIMPKIFEPGMHFRKSRTGYARPTGMGLPLSRRLVEAHGGTLEAYNREDQHGAEFVVKLPVALVRREGIED